MADIVIINPRFDTSFWGLEHCMSLLGKRANLPVACLALLAALVPDHHCVTLIDENVEEIDFDRLARADLVCLTGMSIQGRRMCEILKEVRSRGVMTVVGGPLATVEEEILDGLADVVFVGEADETWPQFLRDWERGRHKLRYQQAEKTDMARLPLPRIDLLKADRYMFGSMQISRGCPFTCEFCDIIVTFGRRPRLKTSEQVLAELEAFRQAGLNIIFVVDDNLIGNKKAIKPILRDIIRWQQECAYPLTLFTEASIDLAEDEEMMELMGLANFQSVFIGIESPNENSLIETKKLQNVRPKAGSLVERVRRIHAHGIDVLCGMIVGFDHDDASAFDAIADFIAEARIANALIGQLHAIPTTPLYDRLKQDGRLNDAAATNRYGTNVIPLGMSQAELRRGFIQLMRSRLYHGRLFRAPRRSLHRSKIRCRALPPTVLATPSACLGGTASRRLCQIHRHLNALAPPRKGSGASNDISNATGARLAGPLAQPPHAFRLCDENRAAFSLRGNDAGLGTRHDRRWRYPRGRTLLLARHAGGLGPRGRQLTSMQVRT